MEIYRSASLRTQFRGIDYFKEKKVISIKKINDNEYNGQVKENNKIFQKYIQKISRKKLEDSLLDCLYHVEWLYDRFIRNKVGY